MNRLEVASRNYSFEVTKEEFTLITDMDGEHLLWSDTLSAKLDEVIGVDNADYNGHFGSYIYFRLAAEDDCGEKQDEITNMIMDYILQARED